MGYYTNYTLQIFGEEKKIQKCKKDIVALDSDIFSELVDCGFSELKWYEHQDELKEIAKKNPDVIIQLCGSGEEGTDQWEERYRGDKFERVEMQCY